jgi:hypothetical protein
MRGGDKTFNRTKACVHCPYQFEERGIIIIVNVKECAKTVYTKKGKQYIKAQ